MNFTHTHTHTHTHTTQRRMLKISFPDRAIDRWNALPEEVVCVKSIHSFKEKNDEIMSKDGTYRA